MVDKSSIYVIMYIQYKERSRHMVSRLSRGIITSLSRRIIMSMSLLAVIMLSTGCSSTGGNHDGFWSLVGEGALRDPRLRPWDPPIGVGYGARIPNMQGDWERFCATEKERVANGCIQ